MNPPLALIAAVGRNGAIGLKNGLPWRLPGDLRHFRALTMGKPLIMGRTTFASLGRPLPGRHLVVVSRDPAFSAPEGVAHARSVADAIDLAGGRAADHGASEIMVAGGASLYRALMPQADRLDLTEVGLAPEADTFFPPVAPEVWQEVDRSPQMPGPGDEAPFTFVTYRRRI